MHLTAMLAAALLGGIALYRRGRRRRSSRITPRVEYQSIAEVHDEWLARLEASR